MSDTADGQAHRFPTAAVVLVLVKSGVIPRLAYLASYDMWVPYIREQHNFYPVDPLLVHIRGGAVGQINRATKSRPFPFAHGKQGS